MKSQPKSPGAILKKTFKLILKFICETEGTRIVNTILFKKTQNCRTFTTGISRVIIKF